MDTCGRQFAHHPPLCSGPAPRVADLAPASRRRVDETSRGGTEFVSAVRARHPTATDTGISNGTAATHRQVREQDDVQRRPTQQRNQAGEDRDAEYGGNVAGEAHPRRDRHDAPERGPDLDEPGDHADGQSSSHSGAPSTEGTEVGTGSPGYLLRPPRGVLVIVVVPRLRVNVTPRRRASAVPVNPPPACGCCGDRG
jgi:hypothetical protein